MRPLTDTIGAQIDGIDLRRPLPREDVAQILDAWWSYRVLLLRDQSIDDPAHAAFAAHFGTPAIFASGASAAESSCIYGASNTADDSALLPLGHERVKLLKMNWFWHVDGCYRAKPNRGVVLRALVVPPIGGDTVFADLRLAYVTLPPTLRSTIEGLICRHSFAHMIECCGMPPVTPLEAARLPEASHPLVWRHSDGRRSLFLSPPYMAHIDGLSYNNSRALVEELTEWASADRFVYLHRWLPGDVLIWDNRWTMHKVTPYDLACHRRVMRGATLVGTETVSSHA
ncbi:MAG: TauD/TfdA family dioxygenase [Candidatus Accumulibacter cognatus]|uniref:TauD/TfdA family dioxygenase n=1 Tax=Candidatus Accumulibacter cognatus TaxID=2954383 RepID=A0A7D5NC00_9PROT|nr:MAG: TauD/TfdA family dioxygenase [Candidatus Accumulibacter cognatus]